MRLAIGALLLLTSGSVLGAEKFSLEVTDSGIAIRGAIGDVAWLGVANEPAGGNPRIVVRSMLFRQPNASDTPQIQLPDGVAPRSLWAAVDTITGEIASVTSKLFKLKLKPAEDVVEETSRFRIKSEWVELLIVRPGAGVWRMTAGDGGQNDEDGLSNGIIALPLSTAVPLGDATPPPAALRPKDIVIVIDVPAMTIYTVKK